MKSARAHAPGPTARPAWLVPLVAVALGALLLLQGATGSTSSLKAEPRAPVGLPEAVKGGQASVVREVPAGPKGHAPTTEAWVSTTDHDAVGNLGITTVVSLPSSPLLPGQNWTFLEVEPVNATETVGVGMFGFENTSGPTWYSEYFVWNSHGRPGNLTVLNRTNIWRAGQSVDLGIAWVWGDWWNFTAQGHLINGTSVNGTVNLGSPMAGAFEPASPFATSPEVVIEGNTTVLPSQVVFASVLTYLIPNLPTYLPGEEPQNGIWGMSSSGWLAQGEDQTASAFGEYTVFVGPGVGFAPTNGTWIWGLGGPLLQPWENISTGGAAEANEGFGMNISLNRSSDAPGATSYVATAWEIVAPGDVLGVGAWVNAPGDVTTPFYVQDLDGNTLQYICDFSRPSPGVPAYLEAQALYDNWTFWVDNFNMVGGEDSDSVGNLTVPVSVVPAGSLTWTTIDLWGEPPSPGTALDLSVAMLVNESGNWTIPTAGYVAPLSGCTSSCASESMEGFSQDPLLLPGAVVADPALPPLSVGTALWQGTAFPSSTVAWSGIPAVVGSWTNLTADLWVNVSGAPVASPTLQLDLPLGVTAGPLRQVAPGLVAVPLTFPLEVGQASLALSAQGGGPGVLPSSSEAQTELTEGGLNITGHAEAASLAPGASTTIAVWVNGTAGAGPRTTVDLMATSDLGGVLVAQGLSGTGTDYLFSYTAPSTVGNATDEVSFVGEELGFRSALGTVPVPVVPPSMVLSARGPVTTVLSGAEVSLEAWLNTTSASPISGATFEAGFAISGVQSVASTSPAPGVYELTVTAPQVPFNSSLPVLVEAEARGFQDAEVRVAVSVVLGLLAVSLGLPPPTAGVYPIDINVTEEGSPVDGALASLTCSGGVVLVGTVVTTIAGTASFSWVPPVSGSGKYSFTLTVTAAGAVPHVLNFTITLPGSKSSSPPVPAWWLLLVGPLAILAIFLVLWAIGRKRAGPPRPPVVEVRKASPPASEGKVEGEAAVSAEAPKEGTDSWVPADSATKDVQPPGPDVGRSEPEGGSHDGPDAPSEEPASQGSSEP